MSGIFESAGSKSTPEDGGISTLDLAELPADQKKVMLALLRDQPQYPDGMPAAVLKAQIGDAVEDIDATLDTLQRENWVTITDEGEPLRYRIAFRPRRAKKTGYSLWSILSDRST